jgi:hypothetical protein
VRRHLARELRRTDEVLVLNDLREKGAFAPLDFFFGLPEYRLYQPVKVRPIDDPDRDLQRRHRERCGGSVVFDLTGLISVLRAESDGRSVLLEARSGAGKTVAGIAAMFDCLYAEEGSPPRLDGLVPCPLRDWRLDGALLEAVERGSAKVTPQLIWDALARHAGHGSGAMVRQWLRLGPPLLLIIDLNAVDPKVRGAVAEGLIEFIRSNDARRIGHRAVVTYRSHAQDETLKALGTASLDGRRLFVRAELEALDARAAYAYLENLRSVEAHSDWRRGGPS